MSLQSKDPTYEAGRDKKAETMRASLQGERFIRVFPVKIQERSREIDRQRAQIRLIIMLDVPLGLKAFFSQSRLSFARFRPR